MSHKGSRQRFEISIPPAERGPSGEEVSGMIFEKKSCMGVRKFRQLLGFSEKMHSQFLILFNKYAPSALVFQVRCTVRSFFFQQHSPSRILQCKRCIVRTFFPKQDAPSSSLVPQSCTVSLEQVLVYGCSGVTIVLRAAMQRNRHRARITLKTKAFHQSDGWWT